MRVGTGEEIDLLNMLFRKLDREGFEIDSLSFLPEMLESGDGVKLTVTAPNGLRYVLTLTQIHDVIH